MEQQVEMIFLLANGSGVTERIRIDSSGHMGLGVTPNTSWPSNGDFRALQIGTGACVFGRGSGDEDRGGIAVNFYHDGSARKYLANGHASIIDLQDGLIIFSNAASNSSGAGAAMTANERARINSDGQLLVGTTETSPYANRTLMTNKSGGNYVSVTTDSSNDCGIVFGDGTANNSANYESYIAHSNSTNDFTINVNQGNNSRYLRVKSSTGNVEIGAGNLVLAAGKGIDFSADGNVTGMSNELLDDYEQGSWTATITGIGGGTNPSFSAQSSSAGYTKVGNICHIYAYVYNINVSSSGSGTICTISGLPFASGAHYYPGSVTHDTVLTGCAGGYVQANNNSPHFIPIADGTTSGKLPATGNTKYIMIAASYATQ